MQIWRCTGDPPGHAQKEREGGKRSIFCFHFQPGGSCGGPSCRHSRDVCSSTGQSLVPKERATVERVQEQHSFHTKITDSALSEHSYIFFIIIFFTPRLLCLLVCLGEKVQLP